MATNYPVPPTYAQPVIKDDKTGEWKFNPIWLSWFLDLARLLGLAGGAGGTIDHNSTSGLQGGILSEYYHLTSALLSFVADGPAQPVSAVTVGASPVVYQNTGAWTEALYVTGGTLTAVEISRDGATYYGIATDRAAVLARGDYLRVTYAVAPTAITAFPL